MRRLILLPAFLLLMACETEPDFLGMDYEASMSRVARSDYRFLGDLDYERFDTDSVQSIGEGSGYYIGRIFEKKGNRGAAFHFYRQQWEVDASPWRVLSGYRLLALADTTERREIALSVAELLLASPDGSAGDEALGEEASDVLDAEQRGEIVLARADLLLELGRPQELRALEAAVDAVPALAIRLAHGALLEQDSAELHSWLRTALAYAPRDPAWSELLSAVEKASVHETSGDGSDTDESDTDRAARGVLDRWMVEYLRYRTQVASSDWGPAAAFLAGYSNPRGNEDGVGFEDAGESIAVPHEVLLTRAGIADIRETHFRASRPQEGATMLLSLADLTPEEHRHYIYQSAGRLYRNRGEHHRAMEVLKDAMDRSSDADDSDTALYHYLHAAVSADATGLAERLESVAERMNDRSRFNQAYERLLANLVPARRWDLIASSYETLREFGSERSAAQFAVAYAAAMRGNLVAGPESHDARDPYEYVLRPAVEQRASPYYAIVSAVMLGEEPRALPGDPDAERSAVAGPDDPLVSGYLDYGLLRHAYRAIYDDRRRTGSAVTTEVAQALAREGMLLESLRVANRLSRIDGLVVDRDLARLVYPRAYEEELLAVTSEYELPDYMFYGLVREESYFDSGIQSWVGATGLAQLMPATAADVAVRLGVSDYDLTDPETNLRFGARYFSDLYRSFGEWTPSLAAYNAGQGRVRQWNRLRGDLPPILYHEGIPLLETRDYVRKILVSAVNYRHLYGNGDVFETVEDFFPGIRIAE